MFTNIYRGRKEKCHSVEPQKYYTVVELYVTVIHRSLTLLYNYISQKRPSEVEVDKVLLKSFAKSDEDVYENTSTQILKKKTSDSKKTSLCQLLKSVTLL